MRPTRRPIARQALPALFLLTLTLPLASGCYKRVVRAEGIGAEARYDVQRQVPTERPLLAPLFGDFSDVGQNGVANDPGEDPWEG